MYEVIASMKKFVITIEETTSQSFEILAENSNEAICIAEGKYRNGEIVLEPGALTFKQMAVIEPDDDTTEWYEF